MKQQLFTTDNAVNTECAVNTKCRGRLLAMAAGILSVLILLVTALQFVISAGADRYSEYSDDCRKFMMDYMKESSSYGTLVNKTRSPYRNYVESLGRNTLFQADLVAWKIATFDLKNGATQVTNSKEYKYYLGILMDLLSECTQDKDFLGKVKDVSDASHVSTVKAVMNYNEKYNNLYMELNPSEADEIKDVLSEISTVKGYLSTVSNFSDLVEQAKNLDDLLYKLSQAQVICDLMTGYGNIMQDMYNKCNDDNSALKAALLNMRDLCNQSMSKIDMVTLFAGSTVAEEAMKMALGAVQKEIVNAMGLTGAAITLAQSAGKMYANALFGTEDMLTAYYQMDALYDIENLVRLALARADDADSFFSAFSLYENIMYKGVTYSEKYMKSIYEDSVVGALFAWASGKDKEYEVFKSNMSSFKVDTYASFSSLQKSAYNAFINSKYTSDIRSYFTVTDLYILPSDEEIKQNDEEIEKLSIQACGLPDENYTLDNDLTISNNLYHSSGTIDLNGHTLTINGDLFLNGGNITISGGSLIVKGSFNAYNANYHTDGTVTYATGGYLLMNNGNDKVIICNDFNTCHNYYFTNSYGDFSKLCKGSIEIRGNIHDYYNKDENYNGLKSLGTKFIFNGKGTQTIDADDGSIIFQELVFNNSDNREIVINCKISGDILSDTTIKSSLKISSVRMHGYNLNVSGDLTVTGNLSLNGGDLYVKNNLVNNGSVSLGGSFVAIGENYRAYTAVEHSDGTITYKNGGELYMNSPSDKVVVNGDFFSYSNYRPVYSSDPHPLRYGVIEVKGNLSDLYAGDANNGLSSSGTKFVFSGKGNQKIEASDGFIQFGDLEFVDSANRKIEVNCRISGNLKCDTYISGNFNFSGSLNANKLHVSDDMVINDKLTLDSGDLIVGKNLYNYGGILFGGGYVTVNGDYYACKQNLHSDGSVTFNMGGYLSMTDPSDKMSVHGDFNTNNDCDSNNSKSVLKCGVITVSGNLTDYYNDGDKYYGLSSKGTKFIFDGKNSQEIKAVDGYICFQEIEFVDSQHRDITIECDIYGTIYSETFIKGNLAYSGRLNGNNLNVDGNLTVYGDLNLNGGDLIVKNNLYNYGKISVDGGYVITDGNYIAFKKQTGADGTVTYSNCGGFYMQNVSDKIVIRGNFDTCVDYYPVSNRKFGLFYGTVEIGGNLNDYFVSDDENHGLYFNGSKLILNGTSQQTINVADNKIHISRIDFKNQNVVVPCSLKANVAMPIIVHDYSDQWTVDEEADCVNDGSKSRHCSRCDAKTDVTVIEAKGHTEVVDKAVAATCTADGYTEGKHCSVCGTVLVAQNVIKSPGEHTFGEWQTTVKPTCTEGGEMIRSCSVCGAEETKTIDALGHDYSEQWTVDEEADCVNDGSKSRHCSRCDAKTDVTVIEAKGHTEVVDKAVAATCTADGYTEGKHCSVCNAVIKAQEKIAATGHKYIETVVEPSYSNRGYTLYECSVCGYSYKDNYEEQLIVPAVTGFASGSQTKSSAVLGWDKVSGADGYAVELYTGGKWNEVFRTSDSSVTSCTVGSLKADSTYSLRIRAFKDTDDGTVYSDYTRLAVKTKLAGVTGLKAQGVTATAVKLDWARNAGATGYIIEQYKGGKWTQLAVTKNNTTLTFTVKGLAECTPYSFRVKTYKNDGGKTNYSDYVTVKASTLLGTVKNAKVTSTTGTWITLGWDRNTGATGYVLEQYKGGRWTEIAVTKNNTTLKFTVKGLKNDTTYSFRIRTYKTVGDTTTYGSYVRIVGTTDIPNVAKFTGSAVSASAVKLDWSKNDKATGYVIEQYKGGRWTEIKAVDNDITEITVEGLAKGTAYTFRIKSVKTVDGADKSSEYASVKVNTAE